MQRTHELLSPHFIWMIGGFRDHWILGAFIACVVLVVFDGLDLDGDVYFALGSSSVGLSHLAFGNGFES